MSVTASESAERLDIGQALQDLFNAVLRNFGPLALLGLVLGGLPTALLYLGIALGDQQPIYILPGLVGLIAAFVARPVLYGAVIYRTVRSLDGSPTTLGESLVAGWRRWGDMLGLIIWSGLLTGLGTILLIVPGIYLALQWAVAGPSLILSARGISDSMDHSARLTKGRRWAMLLFCLAAAAILFVAYMPLALVDGVVALSGSKVLPFVVSALLSNALTNVAFPLIAAVLYRRLRGDAVGEGAEALAEVFA
jgi:hypothetical protein